VQWTRIKWIPECIVYTVYSADGVKYSILIFISIKSIRVPLSGNILNIRFSSWRANSSGRLVTLLVALMRTVHVPYTIVHECIVHNIMTPAKQVRESR
jgi:hypothetical protein